MKENKIQNITNVNINQPKQKSLKLNMAFNFTRTLLGVLFPLITFPYASRILLPEGLGKINFAQSVIQYFALFASLGISTYGTKCVANYRDDKQKLSKFCSEIFIINLISTLVSYILLAFAIILVPKFSVESRLLCICSGTILFTTLGMEWLYTGLEEFKYITIRAFIFQIISLILLFVFVHDTGDYLKYASISVFSNVGSNVCNFIHSRKFIKFSTCKKIELKQHLKPIFRFFAIALIINIYTVLDTVMLGFISGNTEVGLYTSASKIDKLILSLVFSACAVLLPRFAYYAGIGDKDEFYKLFYKATSFIMCLSIPCAVGLFLLGEPIILLLSGKEYVNAILPMKVMTPILVSISLGSVIGGEFFVAIGKEKFTIIADIVGSVLNFTFNLILIPKYGAVGAAIGTVIAEFAVAITDILLGVKYFVVTKLFAQFWQYLVSAAFMGGAVFLSIINIEKNITKICIGISVGVVTYALLLLLLHNNVAWQLLEIIKNKFKRDKK